MAQIVTTETCNLACTEILTDPHHTPKLGQSDLLYVSKSLTGKSGREYVFSSQLGLAAHGMLVYKYSTYKRQKMFAICAFSHLLTSCQSCKICWVRNHESHFRLFGGVAVLACGSGVGCRRSRLEHFDGHDQRDGDAW